MYPGCVWICGSSRQVRIYNLNYQLQATHERAQKPGERLTHPDHIPAGKLPALTQTRESVQAEAQQIGPASAQIVQSLLAHPVLDRLTTAGRLVRLARKYNAQRLEAACRKALDYGDPSYKTVKGILKQGTEVQPAPVLVDLPLATTFARSSCELVGALAEVPSWN